MYRSSVDASRSSAGEDSHRIAEKLGCEKEVTFAVCR